MSANITVARDRAGLEGGGRSGGIQQGYHPAGEYEVTEDHGKKEGRNT